MRSKVIVGLTIAAFLTLSAGAAMAAKQADELAAFKAEMKNFDDQIALKKAVGPAVDKRLAQETKAIIDRYALEKQKRQQQRELAKRMKAQAAAVAQVDDGVVPAGRAFRRAFTALLGLGMHTGGAIINGAGTGVTSPTDSPFEYLLLGVPSLCRGVTTAFGQGAEFTVMSAYDLGNYGNAFDNANRADPAQLGYVASETIKWGPFAQVFLVAGAATAPACAAAGILAPIGGMCYGGTVATLATTNTAGAYLVGKGTDMAEKAVFK